MRQWMTKYINNIICNHLSNDPVNYYLMTTIDGASAGAGAGAGIVFLGLPCLTGCTKSGRTAH